MRRITLNGRLETVAAGTLAELVLQQGLKPERLVVEHNRTIVRQERWPHVQLRDGDSVEFLSFVGGG